MPSARQMDARETTPKVHASGAREEVSPAPHGCKADIFEVLVFKLMWPTKTGSPLSRSIDLNGNEGLGWMPFKS